MSIAAVSRFRRGDRGDQPRRAGLIMASVLIGVLASSATVLTATRAAFSDTTSNSGNSFSAGTVDLVDDDSDSALFTVTNLVPGQSVTRCIEVTYQGTIANPDAVRLYSGGLVDSGSLASELDLTVEEGTGGTFATCTGFNPSAVIESGTLADFDTDHTAYSNGVGSWDPSATPDSRTYRITVALSSKAANSAQGQSVTGLTFTWEVQS
ncbi:hypothetical protein BH18ACT5_BH18ACT5_16450 [soil metagenome]